MATIAAPVDFLGVKIAAQGLSPLVRAIGAKQPEARRFHDDDHDGSPARRPAVPRHDDATARTVPALKFLCVDGHGDPNTSAAYASAIQALYSVSYAAKFAVQKAGGPAFKVSPLEGLWWAQDLSAFSAAEKSNWDWTMMIRQPDALSGDLVERLAEQVAAKKSMPEARELRLISVEEGAAAQVLHIGPYATEAPTIARLYEFIRRQGFTFDGHRHKHHEIYLGDPRRSAPEKLRTIIRQPYAAS